MKRKNLTFLLTALLLLSAVTVSLASSPASLNPDRIINRYRKAAGSRAKTTRMTGSVKLASGVTGRFTVTSAGPDRQRTDIEAAGSGFTRCYNGKSAWRLDAQGLSTMNGRDAKALRLSTVLEINRIADLSRYRIIPSLTEGLAVEGRDTDGIRFSMQDCAVKLFFDRANGLLVKQEREINGTTEEILYGDYRKVDGMMEPFSLRIKDGSGEIAVTIESVEHNRPVDESFFHYPNTGGEGLPDVETLMKSLMTNQEKSEELREHYSFKETRIERELDGKDRVKATKTLVYDVTPVKGVMLRRLVSVDGKPLSPDKQAKEDRRIQKEAQDAVKEREKRDRKREEARRKGKEYEDEEHVSILTFLRNCQFSSMRREVLGGHVVIAFDFEPKKNLKPSSLAEKFVSKLAGTLWIDEQSRQAARIEAHLVDALKIGGGVLASLSPSTSVVLEQEKVNDEVWLPSYSDENISFKALMFAKFSQHATTRFSDYRKYKIEGDYKDK